MKKTSKILVSLFIFINIFTINIFAVDLAYIEEALIHIGIDEEYSENIVQYLEGISITESDVQKIENNINDIKSFIEDSKALIHIGIDEEYSENIVQYLEGISITESDVQKIENNINDIKSFIEDSKDEEEINFLKYYSVYDNIMDISKLLNLNLDFDINNLNIKLIDEKNNNVLFEGDINSLVQIYSNYKESNYNINIEEIVEDINLNIKENSGEEKINNSEDKFNNETNNSLNIERNISNSNNNSEINAVLDEYIDKLNKYNESLLLKKNNDMLELKIIVFIFGIALTLFIVFKIISRVKRLQQNQFEE